ncbi:pyrimidine utilization protein A [Paracraurococcus ruber]|uniref:Pyrimidine monooxygenase RutA n=1 Tax=Paracraurococcus ruber TaxID=77675 RepID=A0ABS1CUN7_9PROT|nr:pyrimidine utilization protein A [Paracraurococcus ruber]MBK1658040.1 pyrimidine utilization protein A [Paracraurococcus ruber]TDG31742.1 pyrimidine utilization protein A [Paracraurococcus ruber]
MQVGVFIPINNNGWLTSTTSPQYLPSFDLNRRIVQRAEQFGLDFALSMIKLHGFGGKSRFWDYGLESFTLMAGLASVTQRIQLFASIAVLTMPPPIAARMAVTIDSIAPGRFGVNIVSGWQEAEYSQMGIWPGEAHFQQRYEYCGEYVRIMRELWATGESDLKGQFFQMDRCQLLPQPSARIPIICAAQSDKGTRFAAEYGDYNFCVGFGVNQPQRVAPSIARLVEATRATGREVGALVMQMVVADETDEAAMAKWRHYCDGYDHEAMAWRNAQAGADKTTDPYATANRQRNQGDNHPTNQGVFVGSYATVARLLDELAEIPGLSGVMLTFDDFIIGMEQFGTRIQPLMRSRSALRLAA